MARIYPLFSSSRGNATFVGSPSGGILIDAGVSFRRLSKAIADCGLSLGAIRGVFITHEHSDHVKGLKLLSQKAGVPVYGQGRTLRNLIDAGAIWSGAEVQELTAPVSVGDLEIQAFDTPHDTVQSCGYRIHTGDGRTCAVCTDLGHVTKTVSDGLQGCDLVLLEANYDARMLSTGPYPPYVKSRIGSDCGHLSNADCARQAANMIRGGTTRVILGHLSQENNTPALAESTVAAGLCDFRRNQDYLLQVAPVETQDEMVVF